MNILQIAPLWERVPPPAYGGTEAVVTVLTEALVKRGHNVVLRASGDSLTLAELRSVYPQGLRSVGAIKDGTPYIAVHAAEALVDAREFDIVHNHAGEPVMALNALVDVPMLTTMHCLITPDTQIAWEHYRGYFNTLSHAALETDPCLQQLNHVGVVYNAIDVASFPLRTCKDDYLLSLNRISPLKGTHLAIEAARRAGRKLIIAGRINKVDEEYFEALVKPLVNGRDVVFVGEADSKTKRELYAGAACLLNPICWEEPFGLVMVEAMACGTPVISFARGGAPELIVDGDTGFLVDDVSSMVTALQFVDSIDPVRCRRHVEENFDTPIMVDEYVRLYREIAGRPASPPKPAKIPSQPFGNDLVPERVVVA